MYFLCLLPSYGLYAVLCLSFVGCEIPGRLPAPELMLGTGTLLAGSCSCYLNVIPTLLSGSATRDIEGKVNFVEQ